MGFEGSPSPSRAASIPGRPCCFGGRLPPGGALTRRTIREGENVAILGPNGSGKSSFIQTITRELSTKDGRFIADGAKEKGLTATNFGRLFGIPVRILRRNGCCHVKGRPSVRAGTVARPSRGRRGGTPARAGRAIIEVIETPRKSS